MREYLSAQADLVGAIRLPNDAFKKNANTEVTTDLVILRKLRRRRTFRSGMERNRKLYQRHWRSVYQ